MYRTANSTNYPQSLGEKLRTHGWKKLTRLEKKQILADFACVAPFIHPWQAEAICKLLGISPEKIIIRSTEKEALSKKVKACLTSKRIAAAAEFNKLHTTESNFPFNYVEVTSPSAKGTINLLWKDYPIQWINNLEVANEIKTFIDQIKQAKRLAINHEEKP